jgi:NAD(P)-dependent dehydrogenase (short-subunit alcohol dehydrogenase family)
MAGAAAVAGKVVAITGGARGIGFATATRLHRLGAKVAIGDIDEPAVKEAGSEIGLDVYAKLDVTERESFVEFLDEVERRLGPIDVLINNAGICPAGSIVDEPDAVTEKTLAVNLFGVILGTKLAAERMRRRGRGHVINIASLAAVTPVPGIATYCASKHAVLGFTDATRLELRGTGVNLSAVLPHLTNTQMIDGVPSTRGMRNAEPAEIAEAIVGLIGKPKPRVTVTRTAGLITGTLRRLLPQAGTEAAGRVLGADQIFASAVDVDKRRDYERRARSLPD